MKKLWNRFQNQSMRKKMIITYMVIAFVPLCMFAAVVAVVILPDTKRTAGLHTEQVANQISESLDIYIGTIEKMMDSVILNCTEQPAVENEKQVHMEAHLMSIYESFPEIAGVMVAYADDSYYTAGMTRNSRDLFIDEKWYQVGMENDGQIGIISTAVGRNIITNTQYSADTIFSLVKKIPATEYTCEGVLLIDIRHDIIEQLISRVSIGTEGFLYVIDSDGNMVYAPPNEVVYRIDEESFEEGFVTVKGNGYYIADYLSEYTNWRSVGVVPNSDYLQSTYNVFIFLVVTILVCGVFVIVVSYLISNSITKPVSSLQKLMTEVEGGDFSIRFETEYEDEIGKLGGSFNHMLEKIDELVLQLSNEKKSKLEAQLKSLQEQFKPHFLYNTLDTISWMARAHNASDVVRMLESLTTIFRVGLSGGKDYITVREEKMHVENYLYIQEIRYKDKLKYEIDIPETLDAIMIPKLILQPLSENAIYHGLKLKRGGGAIHISGYTKGQELYFEVRDTGVGIEPERLLELKEQLVTEEPLETKAGFGLFYIAERLRLSYGVPDCVAIDSQPGEGTVITVRIPGADKRGGELTNV